MRKLILLIILVIILVSINWFRVLVAQDLSSLSPAEITRLKAQYGQTSAPAPDRPEYYQSPDVFNDTLPNVVSVPLELRSDSVADEARTGFESADSLKSFDALRPFGMELFRHSREGNPPADIASADDYVLGPGDNVLVYLWGRVEREYNLTLDRDGKVFIPKVGDVVVWGLTLQQFRDRMRRHLSKAYSDFDLTVSLGKIRSIRIYVTGEVKFPGAYTVSSLTSVINAVFAAGGPNGRGSMRNIKVMRSGKPVAGIDLYDLLLEGNNSSDIRLQAGDAVFVPVAGARVAVRGEIKRSAIYELRGTETIRQLLALAGSPTAEAYLDRVMLERISSGNTWEVRDLNLLCDSLHPCDDIELVDGDRITVFSIFELRRNMVAVAGQVQHPGYYERNDLTRVSDLIERGQLQPYDVYYDRADIFRRYADNRVEVIPIDLARALSGDSSANIPLEDRDSLHVYNISDVEYDKYVYIEGEIRKPGRYRLYEQMTVEDLIFLAGSYSRGADRGRAELARIDSLGEVTLSYLDFSRPATLSAGLREDDHLYIRQIPEWEMERNMTIAGEVRYPGTYFLTRNNESLYSMLQRAGGFTINAFPKGLVLERSAIRDDLERLQVPTLIHDTQPIVFDSAGNQIHEETFTYRPELMSRLIIDVDKVLASEGREGNVTLEPGDHMFVPSRPSGISVMGAVGANGTLRYHEGRRVKDYIKRAGDFTRQADKKGTRLVRASGEVYAGGGVLGEKVHLGDIIVVPSEIKRDRNWLKSASGVLGVTTGLLTSVYLITKL